MKKIIFILGILLMGTACQAGNVYFVSEKEDGYFGAYNARDMIHADVKLLNQNSDKVCDGMVFLNAPSRSITFKYDHVDAKMLLGCNDKTLMNLDWKLRKANFNFGYGEGSDQLGNTYKFKTVKKKEFKKIIGNQKIKCAGERTNSYLKY